MKKYKSRDFNAESAKMRRTQRRELFYVGRASARRIAY